MGQARDKVGHKSGHATEGRRRLESANGSRRRRRTVSTQQFLDLAFAQAPNETTLQIFLPTAGAIDRGMQMVQVPGFRWKLPDFYCRDAFDGHPVNVKEANNVKFLAERIGDYAIGQCG